MTKITTKVLFVVLTILFLFPFLPFTNAQQIVPIDDFIIDFSNLGTDCIFSYGTDLPTYTSTVPSNLSYPTNIIDQISFSSACVDTTQPYIRSYSFFIVNQSNTVMSFCDIGILKDQGVTLWCDDFNTGGFTTVFAMKFNQSLRWNGTNSEVVIWYNETFIYGSNAIDYYVGNDSTSYASNFPLKKNVYARNYNETTQTPVTNLEFDTMYFRISSDSIFESIYNISWMNFTGFQAVEPNILPTTNLSIEVQCVDPSSRYGTVFINASSSDPENDTPLYSFNNFLDLTNNVTVGFTSTECGYNWLGIYTCKEVKDYSFLDNTIINGSSCNFTQGFYNNDFFNVALGEDEDYDLILQDRCIGDPYWLYDLGELGDNINIQFKFNYFENEDNISMFLYDDRTEQILEFDLVKNNDRLLSYNPQGEIMNLSSDDRTIAVGIYDVLDTNYTLGMLGEDVTFPIPSYRFSNQRILNLTFNSTNIRYFKVLVNNGFVDVSDVIYNGNVESLVFSEEDRFNFSVYSDSFRTVKLYVSDDISNGEDFVELERTVYMPTCSVYHNDTAGKEATGNVPQALGLLGTTYNTMCFSLNIFNNFWDEFYLDVCELGKWIYFMVVIVIGIGVGMALSRFMPALSFGISMMVMGMFLVFGRYVFPYSQNNKIISLLVFGIGTASLVTGLFVGGSGSSGDGDG